ncbi:MAG: UDP-2,3-diacylglucosamine diphosphatase [Verrucomicrobia bacterium]|nr:UDP-2,3-diacylglucosamine diphosphatase [Verrucomicrobiota bacterium]
MKTKKPVLRFKTLILSDVHLGAPDCQIHKVNYLLKHSHCDRLILNGDIIDGWSLGRKGGWTKDHTRFIRLILKKIEKKGTEVIYLRGNHDDILDRFLPLSFGKLRVVDQFIHESGSGRRYMVVHGDLFDAVTQNSKLLAVIGDIGYQSLLKINRLYNRYRHWRGKEYFSLSKAIKAKTKTVVNYISKFEQQVEGFTQKHGCTGFICGHIHTPDDKMIGSVHYLNSGDWVESNTALVEFDDGCMQVMTFSEFLVQLHGDTGPHLRELTEKPATPLPAQAPFLQTAFAALPE